MTEEVWKILEAVNEVIDSNELAAAVKERKFEGEYAFTEEGVENITEQAKGLMSFDVAIRDTNVRESLAKDLKVLHKKSFLSKVEGDLKPAFDELGIDTSEVEFLSDKAADIADKIKALKASKGGDNKELLASLEEDKRKLSGQIEEIETGWKQKLQDQQREFEQQRLKDQYLIKAKSKKWATPYQDDIVQRGILDSVFSDLNAKAVPKLSEDGKILLFDKEFPDKEAYDGKSKLEFQSFLDQKLDPYLQKSEPPKPQNNEPAPRGEETKMTPLQRSVRSNYEDYVASSR